jgi:hypothetical protein
MDRPSVPPPVGDEAASTRTASIKGGNGGGWRRQISGHFTTGELWSMYLTGTFVGVANAAVFHPMDVLRIRYRSTILVNFI